MSRIILSNWKVIRDNSLKTPTLFDGMACVGGNSISFARHFHHVICNEVDESRFKMSTYNMCEVMKYKNVEFHKKSILELAFESLEYHILFLDPEWGGPEYKYKSNILIKIDEEPLEHFCVRVFQSKINLRMIAVKLPTNYDNYYFESVMRRHNLKYELYTNLRKMTLTVISRNLMNL